METVSSSDYLAVKKRQSLTDLYPESSSSCYTSNKQYLTIQTTPVIDSYGDHEQARRFLHNLPYEDLAMLKPSLLYGYRFRPMFVVPRIQIEPYIKNKYVKPFYWNCPIGVCELCTFCDMCSHCDLVHECEACEQTRFFYKTGMFFMNRD